MRASSQSSLTLSQSNILAGSSQQKMHEQHSGACTRPFSTDLSQHLLNLYLRVHNDEIVNTLKESAVSVEFVAERIKELVDESLQQDPLLSFDHTRSTTRLDQHPGLEDELAFCKAQFRTTFAHAEHLESALEEARRQVAALSQELAAAKQANTSLTNQALESLGKYEASQQQARSLEGDSHALKQQCFEAQLLLKRMTVELASLRESLAVAEHDKSSLLARYNGYGEQLQRQQQELVEQAKASVQEKIRHYQA